MTNTRPNPILRLLPSLTDVAFLMPILFLFAKLNGAKTMLSDGDTGWHLRTGEWILANGAVPRVDIFSFTKAGEPWFAWEWLWDVVFGWLHLHFGMAAVVWASILVLCVISVMLFRLTARMCNNRLIAIALTFVAVAGSSIHWLARPHLFTMLFTLIWLTMLERVKEGRWRLLWWMPVLTVLWTNLHGGFFLGMLILAAYAAGSLAQAIFTDDAAARSSALANCRRYGLALAACVGASLVNPYGYHLHVQIVKVFGEPFYFRHISEFQSISFQHPAAVYFEVMLGLSLLHLPSLVRRRELGPAFLIVGWAHLALLVVRNVPLFLFVAAPVAALGLTRMLDAIPHARIPGWFLRRAEALQAISGEIGEIDRYWRLHLISGAAALVLGIGLWNGGHAKLKPEFDPNVYPAKALQSLTRVAAPRRIFTDDEWGDYLIYRLYPHQQVFVDGRGDFYGTDFEQEYINAAEVKHTWQGLFDRYGVDTLLLRADSSLAGAAKESSRWRVIYDDGLALVFELRDTVSNKFSTSKWKNPGDAGTRGTPAPGVSTLKTKRTT